MKGIYSVPAALIRNGLIRTPLGLTIFGSGLAAAALIWASNHDNWSAAFLASSIGYFGGCSTDFVVILLDRHRRK